MITIRSIGCVAAIVLLFRIASAAQGNAPNSPVASTVQQAITAHGVGWTTGQVTDWIAEGSLTYFNANGPQATFPMTLTRKGASQIQRVVKQSMEIHTGTDGTQAWDSLAGHFVVKAQGPPLQFIESQTVRSVPALLNYQQTGLTLTDKGTSDKSHVIEARDSQGRATSFFIDTATSIVTRLEFVTGQGKDAISGRTVPTTDAYVFSDYRLIQALLTPFKIERYINGIKTEEMLFTSVRYNSSVKNDAFKP